MKHFDSQHIRCSVDEQPLWGTTGLRERLRHTQQTFFTSHLPHDHHNGGETDQTSVSGLSSYAVRKRLPTCRISVALCVFKLNHGIP